MQRDPGGRHHGNIRFKDGLWHHCEKQHETRAQSQSNILPQKKAVFIGVLDIAGFEIFTFNGFEKISFFKITNGCIKGLINSFLKL